MTSAKTSGFAAALALFFPILAVGAGAGPVPKTPVDTEGWELVDQGDGITSWKKEVEGSPIVAFRGEAEIPAPIAKIAEVMSDAPRQVEWVHSAAEVRDLAVVSPMERIRYNRTATPFILQDRDFVFSAKTEIDVPARRVTITFKSVEHPSMPDTGRYVRGKLMNSRYVLTALAPDRTLALVEIHADPMGSVPKWIVNLFQRAWPHDTLEGLRRQVAKPDVGEEPSVKAAFAAVFGEKR